MRDPRIDTLARNLVRHSVQAKAGEKVLVQANNMARPLVQALQQNIAKAVVGKDEAIELMLIALICKGHVLIEDVPGVGKTTIIRALVEIYKKKNLQIVLAAPTGRAAKRMTEATGVEAMFGALYLLGQTERINEIFVTVMEGLYGI